MYHTSPQALEAVSRAWTINKLDGFHLVDLITGDIAIISIGTSWQKFLSTARGNSTCDIRAFSRKVLLASKLQSG